MNKKEQLTEGDIIGRKIISVYEKKLERIKRFQNGLTFVRLDSGNIFCLDEIRDPNKDELLNVWGCGHEKGFTEVLSIKKEPNLDSPIKAIVFADYFINSTAILLENDFVLTVDIGEFEAWYGFRRPPAELRNYVIMKIANCKPISPS